MKKFVQKFLRNAFDFLASVKLAVVVILALAIVSGIGTFIEAKYDALTAKKRIYESWWMLSVLGLLVVNLVFAAVDRLPWKPRHIGFLLAHVGIITLIFGSLITQRRGLDGNLVFGVGEKARFVSTTPSDLSVYMSFDGDRFTPLFQREVDFFRKPLNEEPISIPIGNSEIKVLDFIPYARREARVVSSKEIQRGPAVQFRLNNGKADVSEWVIQEGRSPGVFDLGPAQVTISKQFQDPSGKNEIALAPKDQKTIQYRLYKKGETKPFLEGVLKKDSELKTPWMGLVFKIQNYFYHADWDIKYRAQEFPTPLTNSAIKVSYQGSERWLGLNSVLRFFSDEAVYVISYGNRRLDLGFDLKLKEFKVGRYPGSQMAASYASVVEVPEIGEVTISMNEPLKYKGYTFYQASFQENEMGEPIASVLSVNRDPGRWTKYIGSLTIVFGIIHLFYFKRRQRQQKKSAI